MEQIVVKKLVGTCVKKLMGIGNYESSRIILHSHKHSQSFLHEIKAEVVLRQGESNGKHILLNSEVTDRNLYSALSEVLGKIVREAENRLMSTKDAGEGMIRKQKKEQAKSPKEEEILE